MYFFDYEHLKKVLFEKMIIFSPVRGRLGIVHIFWTGNGCLLNMYNGSKTNPSTCVFRHFLTIYYWRAETSWLNPFSRVLVYLKAQLATNFIKEIFRLKVEKSRWFVNTYVILRQSPPILNRFPLNANKTGYQYIFACKQKHLFME